MNFVDFLGLTPGYQYGSMDDAAREAMDYTRPNISGPNAVEWGGYIYRNRNGSYSYAEPVSGTANGMDIDNFTDPPCKTKTVGIYHLHPGPRAVSTFSWSPFDNMAVSGWGTIYLGVRYTTKIKAWSSKDGTRTFR